jgi:SAM-dependent methyltransferase
MNESLRDRVRRLANASWEKDDPTGWFESLYASANGDTNAVPWADLTVNPNLSQWIEQHGIQGKGKRALVVGCGLGDDAEALAKIGFEVVGFDISQSAIAWCKKRFPSSTVSYCVADLFDAPKSWYQAFDFILESYTLQALPALVRDRAIACIASFVAPNGSLLIICRARDPEEAEGNLPFPLTKNELDNFTNYGLREVTFKDFLDKEKDKIVRRFRIQYEASQ